MQVLQSIDPLPLGKNLDLESPGIRPESWEVPSESATVAATRVQKVYRSYRTRRRLADSAVIVEELWWQVIDFARLNQSTISFFNFSKPESAVSRWNRVSLIASKIGQGLSKDSKALKLAFQHWIEAIDPRHRYGHNLHMYYEKWCESEAGQPFFYWLDIGDGRNVDLPECPRSLLREHCIKYLGPQEREHYEYVPIEGKIVNKQTGELLDTGDGTEGSKWIFVMSTSKKLYAGKKKKGKFHHSSFLAGGTTIAAGRFTAENGVLKTAFIVWENSEDANWGLYLDKSFSCHSSLDQSIWAYSGHYKPSEENLNNFLTFLRENGVDLNEVQVRSLSNEDYYDGPREDQGDNTIESTLFREPPLLQLPMEIEKTEKTLSVEQIVISKTELSIEGNAEAKGSYKRNLSGGLQSPRADVSRKAILERIKSKREARSYQLGDQLSLKWSTGLGPRIGCVADYPMELRMQALEITNLSPHRAQPMNFSPRLPPTVHASQYLASCFSSTSVSGKS